MAKTYCTIITLHLQKEPNAKSQLKVYLRYGIKKKTRVEEMYLYHSQIFYIKF